MTLDTMYIGCDHLWQSMNGRGWYICDKDGNELRDLANYHTHNGLAPTFYFKTKEQAERFGTKLLRRKVWPATVGVLAPQGAK